MNREKSHIKIVILGNIDSGKTTLAGQLICKCGVIDKRIFNQFEKEAIELGKNSFKYAWIFNRLKGERERGMIIDISSWKFETSKNNITLIDAPGNSDYIKCMIRNISFANCALILIPATPGEFEASMTKDGSMRSQILLAHTMGIEHMIILVNKMDITDPPYSENRFNEIKIEVVRLLTKIGYQAQNIIFIPISAWVGDNLIEPSDKMSWFQGHKVHSEESTVIYKTLLESLDSIVLTSEAIHKPLRLILQAIDKTQDDETMLVGYIETGILKSGMTVRFTPSNFSAQVKSIQMHYKTVEEALPGDNVNFIVNGIVKHQLRRGFIVSDAENDPAQEITCFTAQLTILYCPKHITKGHKYAVHCPTAQVTCELAELLEKIDRITGDTIEKSPEFLKKGDTALIKITPLKSICVEKYTDYPSLGRFAIFDQWVLAVGTIKHVEKKNSPIKTETNEN